MESNGDNGENNESSFQRKSKVSPLPPFSLAIGRSWRSASSSAISRAHKPESPTKYSAIVVSILRLRCCRRRRQGGRRSGLAREVAIAPGGMGESGPAAIIFYRGTLSAGCAEASGRYRIVQKKINS